MSLPSRLTRKDLSKLSGEKEKVFNTAILLCLRQVPAFNMLSDAALIEAGRELVADGMLTLINRGDEIGMRLSCTPAEMEAYLSGSH